MNSQNAVNFSQLATLHVKNRGNCLTLTLVVTVIWAGAGQGQVKPVHITKIEA